MLQPVARGDMVLLPSRVHVVRAEPVAPRLLGRVSRKDLPPPPLLTAAPHRELLGIGSRVFVFCTRADAAAVAERICMLGPEDWCIWHTHVHPDHFLLSRQQLSELTQAPLSLSPPRVARAEELDTDAFVRDVVVRHSLVARIVEDVREEVPGLLRLSTCWGIEPVEHAMPTLA